MENKQCIQTTNNKTKIDLQKPIKSEVLMSKHLEPET